MQARSKITTDGYNLRTVGKIKDLPWYRGSIRKITPVVFDDKQYPFIEWDVEIKQDDYFPDELKDWLGEFTWDWTPFKLRDDTGECRSRWESGPYFDPAYSYEDRVSYYQKEGMSKGLADYNANKEIRNDADTLRKFHDGYRFYGFVKVSASIDGVEIAEDSIGGVDMECESDPYVQEVIVECKRNVLASLLDAVEDKFNQFSEIYNTVQTALATS
jgi:hypothetical protein